MKLTHKPASIYTHPTLAAYEFSRMECTLKAFKVASACMVAVPMVMVCGVVIYGGVRNSMPDRSVTYGADRVNSVNRHAGASISPSYSDLEVNATDRETVEYQVN